jgi:methylase of polypeptide subunit release factors
MDLQDPVQDNAQTDRPALGHQKVSILAIGKALRAAGYYFVAPTPLTYSRVLLRSRPGASDPLTQAFGWNRPFHLVDLAEPYRELLSRGGLLSSAGGAFRSLVRFSTLDGMVFAHSAYPTTQSDAVFFGPDTYRFARAIRWLADLAPTFHPRTVIDVGTGSGAGGIFAASTFPGVSRTILADINHRALAYAEVNGALNNTCVETRHSDVLADLDAEGDFIISNPPYLVDGRARAYRHGGGDWGCALGARILEEALGRLTPGGRLLLYTGAPIVDGVDMFLKAAEGTLTRRVRNFRYEEQDPDVFGEELDHAPYDCADRIATVVLHVTAADIIR